MNHLARRMTALLLCMLLALTPVFSLAVSYKGRPADSIASYDKDHPENLRSSNLYAESALLIDARTGEVLFSKDPDLQRFPASITKLMTALVVMDSLPLDRVVTVTDVIRTVEPTIMSLVEGEEITVNDLLYGMLLKSANDAAAVLAVEAGGSLEGFSAMMNEKAAELGCTSSNFVVPHGLPNAEHYTTASDMAKVAMALLRNETLKAIVSTRTHTVQPTNKTAETRKLRNTNALLPDSGSEYAYDGALGMKTGYTDASQSTFVGAAERGSLTLISVTLGTTKEGKWLDTKKLLDYGFAAYGAVYLPDIWGDTSSWALTVNNADGGYAAKTRAIPLGLPEDTDESSLYLLLPKADAEAAAANPAAYLTVAIEDKQAPIAAGEVCGSVRLAVGERSASLDLVSQSDVPAFVEPSTSVSPAPSSMIPTLTDIGAYAEESSMSWLWWLLLIPGILLVAFVLLLVTASLRRRRRRQKRLARSYSRVRGRSYME